MPSTPKAIQDLLDELEASKQSRLRAWNVLQRLRLVLSEAGSSRLVSPDASVPLSLDDVWVNTKSGEYWKPGSTYYAKTKRGGYMTE
jgi:hypothetical protein